MRSREEQIQPVKNDSDLERDYNEAEVSFNRKPAIVCSDSVVTVTDYIISIFVLYDKG